MEKPREPRVGDAIVYFDSLRRELSAIITAVHGEVSGGPTEGHPKQGWNTPCINLVFVTPEESKTDSWGRQTDHASSCVHASDQRVGYYWCWPEEVEANRPEEDKVQTQR